MGLWKADARRGLCDISVVANGRRVNKRAVKLNEAVFISAGDREQTLKLIVERIGRSDISGYLVQPAEGSSETAPTPQPLH